MPLLAAGADAVWLVQIDALSPLWFVVCLPSPLSHDAWQPAAANTSR